MTGGSTSESELERGGSEAFAEEGALSPDNCRSVACP